MALHIIPINDLKEHTQESTCLCAPSVEVVNGEMIFTHHSYDRREHIEQMLEELNDKTEE